MTYTRELVEFLLPAVWDQDAHLGMVQPTAPPQDMPRGSTNKATSGTLAAHLVDIRSAWAKADLAIEERQALLLRYGLDMTESFSAFWLDRPRTTVQYHLYKGVGKLVAQLNGTEFVETIDEAA